MSEAAPRYPTVAYVERGEQIIYVKAEGLCNGCSRPVCDDRSELVYSCERYAPIRPRRVR